jgi:hypothetical protein
MEPKRKAGLFQQTAPSKQTPTTTNKIKNHLETRIGALGPLDHRSLEDTIRGLVQEEPVLETEQTS